MFKEHQQYSVLVAPLPRPLQHHAHAYAYAHAHPNPPAHGRGLSSADRRAWNLGGAVQQHMSGGQFDFVCASTPPQYVQKS